MKLYFSPGACSLHPHIALIEAKLPYTLVQANLQDRTTASGENLDVVSPKGYVPVLELDDGSRLTEGGAIVQWVADQAAPGRLAPIPGTPEHYEFLEWLFFISVELHKNIGSMFNPLQTAEWRTSVETTLGKRLDYLERRVSGRQYLVGDHFTVIDGYLFNVLFWSRLVKFDLARWPAIIAYLTRLRERPSVIQALAEEEFTA